jgi:hypothetical protein
MDDLRPRSPTPKHAPAGLIFRPFSNEEKSRQLFTATILHSLYAKGFPQHK